MSEVHASDPFGHKAFEFSRLDKDKDGFVTVEELHEGLLANGHEQDDVQVGQPLTGVTGAT